MESIIEITRFAGDNSVHGVFDVVDRDLTPEEIQAQYFNLGRCKHDKALFQKFVTYLDGLKKAA